MGNAHQARHTFFSIVDTCMGLAKHQLERAGGFYPFAAMIDSEGRLFTRPVDVGTDTGENHPSAASVARATNAAIHQDLAEGRAWVVALATNVTIPVRFRSQQDPESGIRIDLTTTTEHLVFYVPYSIRSGNASLRHNLVEFSKPYGLRPPLAASGRLH